MLYHYTSLDGLIGILESQGIWASHCEYLNDSSEISHALDYAKHFAGGIYMEDDYIAAFGWTLRDAIEHMERQDVYVSSFSEKPDLLSQWRGYCPKGAGICVGFDQAAVEEYCNQNGFVLSECLYDEDEQRKRIFELVNECFTKFPKPGISRAEYDALSTGQQCEHELAYRMFTSEGDGKFEAKTAVNEFCGAINEYAPLMKNFGFHEESEWRVVARNPDTEVRHRAASSHLVPYIDLSVIKHNKNAIRKIIVGPNPNERRCSASVESLLKSKNLDHVKIEYSNIPFSSW